MGKYVLTYKGGAMAPTEAEIQASMAKWGQWFGDLGEAVADAGNPFGPSTAVGAGGTRREVTGGLGGYSILTAANLEAAADLAKGCPVLEGGGTVEIYEAMDM
jgi:hypothetical protein